jgi:trimeric autotransporter adhesin
MKMSAGVKMLTMSWAPSAGATGYRLFENPDGSGFLQLGSDFATSSANVGITVYRFPWSEAQFGVKACNSAGCSGQSTAVHAADYMLPSIGYFKPSNTKMAYGGQLVFGTSVAVSADGSTMAVGARGEASEATGINGNQADNSQTYAGAVYVFTQSKGVWSQQAYVKASNTAAWYMFGSSVALSADGNTLAVGSTGESGSSTGINGSQLQTCYNCSYGAVYVFTRSNQTWSQQAYIKSAYNLMGYGGGFGGSVALSNDGNTLAVGEQGDSSNATGINGNPANTSDPGAGSVYVFSRVGSTWSQNAYLKSSMTQAGAGFGSAIALSGDASTLAVAAGGESNVPYDPNNPPPAGDGAVYVFANSGGTWSQQAHFFPPIANSGEEFGRAVSISNDGNALAIGAAGDPSDAMGINGDQTNSGAFGAGAAFIFARSSGAWAQQTYFKASNTMANQLFGAALALSPDGSTLVVGAPDEASSAAGINGNQFDTSLNGQGAAYAFSQTGGQWSQVAYIKASNPRYQPETPNFGSALALSSGGTVLAVSSPSESSGATGIDGSQTDKSVAGAGAIYVY